MLRPYQAELKKEIYSGWEKCDFILAVLPTGGGKTKTFADIIHEHNSPTCAIAHRQELVSQISTALNREGVRHKIIAPAKVVKSCVRLHMEDRGVSYYDPNALTAVAGVDTLIRRGEELLNWRRSVTLWVQDEAHHVLKANKWGKAAVLFPNAKGLGVTATPTRADGKGLGGHSDGLFNLLVTGPNMRDLIDAGYLTDYKIYAPPSDLDLSGVTISDTTGDFNPAQVTQAVKRSHVLGDVVDSYLKFCNGKRGITFTSSVEMAQELAERFTAAGVPAKMVSADTPDLERYHAVRDLAAGRLLQLVNVDLFGEGVDVPAVEVVSFARPTASYSLYVQQFGRALRLFEGKDRAIILDHVGNVLRHGLPDAPRAWTLDRREKKATKQKDPNVIPLRACSSCTMVYERVFKECPHCGYYPIPVGRAAPEQVDGDLLELDEETLNRMRGAIAEVDKTLEEKRAELARKYVPEIGIRAGVKRHRELQEAQGELRGVMATWGGYQTELGRSDSEAQRRFFHRFGVDVLTAQALPTKDAIELKKLITIDILSNNAL